MITRRLNGNILNCRFFSFCKSCRVPNSFVSTSASSQNRSHKVENKNVQIQLLEDHKKKYENTFGDLNTFEHMFLKLKEDPEDVIEYKRAKAARGRNTNQYIKELQSLLAARNYKKAVNVLEIDMRNDKIPLNRHAYKMLINYNALLGNLDEAYRLYKAFKERGGVVTGAMFTSMFNACANSFKTFQAIKIANSLRESMMNSEHHSPNFSNFNAMLKAYGRHGDIQTCLEIVDEVLEKRDKVRADTYAFLIQACISDQNSGLRHALLVWRKMIQYKIKPNTFTFNLLLRCVRDCALGDVVLLPELIKQILHESKYFFKRKVKIETIDGERRRTVLKIPIKFENVNESEQSINTESSEHNNIKTNDSDIDKLNNTFKGLLSSSNFENSYQNHEVSSGQKEFHKDILTEASEINQEKDFQSIVDGNSSYSESCLPNLLISSPTVGSVVEFGKFREPHDRLLLLGGVKGFLKAMQEYKVSPDIKTFTLLLHCIPPTKEAEEEIISLARAQNLKLDVAFFNALLKRRICRKEDSVKEGLQLMHALNLAPDLETFTVLAHGCDTYESGKDLLQTLSSHKYRPNVAILDVLLKNAEQSRNIKYVHEILRVAKEEETTLDPRFVSRLSRFVHKEFYLRGKENRNKENLEDSKEKLLSPEKTSVEPAV